MKNLDKSFVHEVLDVLTRHVPKLRDHDAIDVAQTDHSQFMVRVKPNYRPVDMVDAIPDAVWDEGLRGQTLHCVLENGTLRCLTSEQHTRYLRLTCYAGRRWTLTEIQPHRDTYHASTILSSYLEWRLEDKVDRRAARPRIDEVLHNWMDRANSLGYPRTILQPMQVLELVHSLHLNEYTDDPVSVLLIDPEKPKICRPT